MIRNVSIYVIGLAVLLTAFQNCGGVSFGTSDSGGTLAVKANLDPIDSDDMDSEAGAPGGGTNAAQADSGMVAEPPASIPPSAVEQMPSASEQEQEYEAEAPVADRAYVCVLHANGKSHRLGYVDGTLVGKTASVKDVCMTKVACESIISQAFAVVGAEKRGYCPDKNPNVVHFSDQELQAMVSEILGQ